MARVPAAPDRVARSAAAPAVRDVVRAVGRTVRSARVPAAGSAAVRPAGSEVGRAAGSEAGRAAASEAGRVGRRAVARITGTSSSGRDSADRGRPVGVTPRRGRTRTARPAAAADPPGRGEAARQETRVRGRARPATGVPGRPGAGREMPAGGADPGRRTGASGAPPIRDIDGAPTPAQPRRRGRARAGDPTVRDPASASAATAPGDRPTTVDPGRPTGRTSGGLPTHRAVHPRQGRRDVGSRGLPIGKGGGRRSIVPRRPGRPRGSVSSPRTRSSSPGGGRSRRLSSPAGRRSACSSSRIGGRRSSGSSSTRRTCGSRLWRSRAAR